MHRKLLLMAFEKVKEELEKESGVTPSPNKCVIRLSEIVSEKFAYSPKSFYTLYKRTIDTPENNFKIPQIEVIQSLSKYLEYDNYEDFILKNSVSPPKNVDNASGLLNTPENTNIGEGNEQERSVLHNPIKGEWKITKPPILVALGVLVVIIFSVYLFVDRQKWMVWNGKQYQIVGFDKEKEKEGILTLYNEDSYQYLKKIKPNCNTPFFNVDGSVRIWYGKNKEGNYEYFTDHGLHPETGKTLKPITKYIIVKYICSENDN